MRLDYHRLLRRSWRVVDRLGNGRHNDYTRWRLVKHSLRRAPGGLAHIGLSSFSGVVAMASDLARLVADKVRSGALPLEPPGRSFVGKGTVRRCDVCEQAITEDQLEYEVDVSEGRTLRFHDRCHDMWRQARG